LSIRIIEATGSYSLSRRERVGVRVLLSPSPAERVGVRVQLLARRLHLPVMLVSWNL
jgi:hypothetical protein